MVAFSFAIALPAQAAEAPAAATKEPAKQIDAEKKRLKKPVTVDSDSLEADNAKGIVIFKGNVIAEEEFILCADTLSISYGDDKKKEIREIVATGGVKIFQAGKTATAGKAVYDRAAGKMVLTGKPRIKQCGDEVAGERITFNVDDETAFVEAGGSSRVRAVIAPDEACDKAGKAGEARVDKEDFCRRAR